ncbi:MAG TPA: DUF1634 domain-containing protein [Gemmatimonadales bacterium]|nr:DUF1634 domain-containing protein [Gemmatimonadales bacterium]
MRVPWRDVKDADVQQAVGNLLRAGVLLAAAVVLAGGAIFLWRHGGAAADYHVFRGEPVYLDHLGAILHDAASGGGRGIIQLGLLVLVATPVARVAFTAVAFAFERDRTYTLVALLVLVLLLKSLAG